MASSASSKVFCMALRIKFCFCFFFNTVRTELRLSPIVEVAQTASVWRASNDYRIPSEVKHHGNDSTTRSISKLYCGCGIRFCWPVHSGSTLQDSGLVEIGTNGFPSPLLFCSLVTLATNAWKQPPRASSNCPKTERSKSTSL